MKFYMNLLKVFPYCFSKNVGGKYLVLVLEEIFLCKALLQAQSNVLKRDQGDLSLVSGPLGGVRVGRWRSATTHPIRVSGSVSGGCGHEWGFLSPH